MSRTLRTLAGIISDRWRTPAKCSACGSNFSCGASLSGCWCSELNLSKDARADLSLQFKGCLCRSCLERYADRSSTRTN